MGRQVLLRLVSARAALTLEHGRFEKSNPEEHPDSSMITLTLASDIIQRGNFTLLADRKAVNEGC